MTRKTAAERQTRWIRHERIPISSLPRSVTTIRSILLLVSGVSLRAGM